tara:strand:+ start:1399 stop:3465 length:2067 start_codon:yes stop_codon:yes gene_type:complete
MRFFILILAYSLSVLFLFQDLIFFGNTFSSGDSYSPYAINHVLDKIRFSSFEWPQWQPWIFSGMPTLEAFTYVNLLYLPSYFLDLLGISDLNIQFIHLVFSAIAMFFLINKLVKNYKIAFISGLLWILNPFLVTMIVFGHGSQMMTAAYFPVTLYFLLQLKDNQSLSNIFLFALFLGLQLQRAHVQIAYYACMLLGFFFIYSFYQTRNKKYATSFFSGIIIAFLIASHIYLPSLEYREMSIRSSVMGSFDYATNWSMHPTELFTYLIPDYFGFGGLLYDGFMPFTDFPNYVGSLVILFSFFSLINISKERIFFWILLIMTILLSLGKYFEIFYQFFYNYLPFFNSFRVPSMILILSNFCLYILSAYGIKDFFKMFKEGFPQFKAELIIYAFLVFSLIDIYRINNRIINPKEDSGQQNQITTIDNFESVFNEDETIIFLKENLGLNRIYPAGSLFTDPKFKYHGIESVGGYHPAKFGHYSELLKNTNNLLSIPVLQFLNVKYFISPVEISHPKLILEKESVFQSVNGSNKVYIYNLDQSNPRAWFVKDVIKEDQNLYNYLNASAFNPSKTAIVDKLDDSRYAIGKILNIDWNVEKIVIDYEAKEKGILVLSEIYYPARWKAYIDEFEVEVLKANGVLRAVEVKAGTNQIIFEYDNTLFKRLHILSNLIVLFICFYLLKPKVMALLKNFK